MGFNFVTSLAVIALAPPLVRSVVTITRAPMETLHQLDAAVDFILPLSPASPSKAGSRNPPPPLSPLLIQLRTVCKMTAYGIPRPVSNMTACGERLGDDAMGVQGSRARLAGMLSGGVWFCVVRAAVILSRVPVVVIAAWWTKLRRTSRDLQDLAKMGFNLVTSLAVIAFAPLLVRSVVTVTRAPMETLHQLDAAVDFILPLSPASPSKAAQPSPAALSPFDPTSYGL